jgi:anti-anti-sigma regulatory factor
MALTVTIENGDVVTLRCKGSIVRGAETSILCAGLQQYGRDVILDLSGVDEIDSAGVGALIALQAAGVYLQLKHPCDSVRDGLTRAGAVSLFEICDASDQPPLALPSDQPTVAVA